MKKFKLMYKIFAGLMISCSAFVCANATNYSSEGYSSGGKEKDVKIYLTDMYGNPIDKDESEKKDKDESDKNEINLKEDKNESNKNEINLNKINLNKINFEKDKKISEDGLKNKLEKLYPKINTMMNRNGTKIQKNYKDCSFLKNLHVDIETGETINIVRDSNNGKLYSEIYNPYDNDEKDLGYQNPAYTYDRDEKKKIHNLFSKANSYSENDKDLINCSDQINNLFLVTKQKALNRNLPLKNKIYSIFLEYVNVLDTLRKNINKLTKNSKNLNKSDEDKYLNKADNQKKLMNDIFEKTILDFEKTFNSISKIMYGREYNLIKYFHDKNYKKIPFKEYKEYINYKDFRNFLNNEKDEDTKKLFKKLYDLIIEEIENLKTKLKLYIFSQTDKKVPYKKIIEELSFILNIKDNKTMSYDEYEKKYGIKNKDKLEKETVFFNLGSFNFDSDEKNENKNSNYSNSRSDSDDEDKYDKRYSGFDEYADEIIKIDEIKDENMKNKLKNMFSSMIKIDKRVNPKNDDNQNDQDDDKDDETNRLIFAMNDSMDNDDEEYDALFTDDSDNDSDDECNDSDDENLEKDDYKNQKKALKSFFDNSNKDK